MDKKQQEARLKQQTKRENQMFKRRKEGIKKKAMELAILCDIPVCLVIQSPDGELEIWPKDPNEVKSILDKYYKKKSHVAQSKNVTQNPGKRTSCNDDKSNKVCARANHDLTNDLCADKNFTECHGQNWSNVVPIQNLEKISNGQSCLKGKEKVEENCVEINTINDHGNQSLGPLGFTEEMHKKQQKARLKQQTQRENQIFKRRKEGIKKKAMELATLCDIPVCLTIQSPDGESEIWPENPNEFKTILDKYYKKKSHVSQSKNVTQNPGKRTSGNGAKSKNMVFASENHRLTNDLCADKDFAESSGQNWSNAVGIQNLEKLSNGKSSLKGKEKVEENCFVVDAINDHGNQGLGPLGITEDVYNLPPLEVIFPNLELGPAKFHGNFASTSKTHFSAYGDNYWQLLPYHDASLWSVPHQDVIVPVQPKFPVGTMPESFPQPDNME